MALVRIAIQAHSTGFDKAARDVNRAVTDAENALTQHAQGALANLERQADNALIAVRGVTAKISQEGKIEDLPRAFEEATRTFKDFAEASRGGVQNLKLMKQTINGITFEFDAMANAAENVGRTFTAAGQKAVDQARDQLELEEKIIRARERSAQAFTASRAQIDRAGGVLASDMGQQAAINDPAVQAARIASGQARARQTTAADALAVGQGTIGRGEHVADVRKEIRVQTELNRKMAKALALQEQLNDAFNFGNRTAATRAKTKALNKQNVELREGQDRVVALRKAVVSLDRVLEEGDTEVDALTHSMEFLTAESGKAAKKLASLQIALDRLNVKGGGSKVDRQALKEKIEEQQALLRSIEKVRRTGLGGSIPGPGARPFGDLESKSLRELQVEIDKLDKKNQKAADSTQELRTEIHELRGEELEKADEAVRVLDRRLTDVAETIETKDVTALRKLELALERSSKEFDDLRIKADKAEDKLRIALEAGIEEPARQAEKELKDLEKQLDRVTTAGERTTREMRELALSTIRSGGDVSNIDAPGFRKEGTGGGRGGGGRAQRGTVDFTDVKREVDKKNPFGGFSRFGSKVLIITGLVYTALGLAQAAFRGFTFAANSVAKAERFSDTLNTYINLSEESGTGLESLGRVFNALGGTVDRFSVVTAAAKARMSGLAEETIPQIAQAARILSRAVGVEVTEAFDRLSRGIAKQEVEILDELGIIVRLNDALEKWALKNGRTVESLSAQERQVAFANEVLGVLAARYAQIGTQMTRTSDKLDIFKARWADLSITMSHGLRGWAAVGLGLGNFAANILEGVFPATLKMKTRMELLDSVVQNFGTSLEGVMGRRGTIADAIAQIELMSAGIRAASPGSLLYQERLDEMNRVLGKMVVTFPELNTVIRSTNFLLKGSTDELRNSLIVLQSEFEVLRKASNEKRGKAFASLQLEIVILTEQLQGAIEKRDDLFLSAPFEFKAMAKARNEVALLTNELSSLQGMFGGGNLTGAKLGPVGEAALTNLTQIFQGLDVGTRLGGVGGVDSDQRKRVANRVEQLMSSLGPSVEQGILTERAAEGIRGQSVAFISGDRNEAMRAVSQMLDILSEGVENAAPDATKAFMFDLFNDLRESALRAFVDAGGRTGGSGLDPTKTLKEIIESRRPGGQRSFDIPIPFTEASRRGRAALSGSIVPLGGIKAATAQATLAETLAKMVIEGEGIAKSNTELQGLTAAFIKGERARLAQEILDIRELTQLKVTAKEQAIEEARITELIRKATTKSKQTELDISETTNSIIRNRVSTFAQSAGNRPVGKLGKVVEGLQADVLTREGDLSAQVLAAQQKEVEARLASESATARKAVADFQATISTTVKGFTEELSDLRAAIRESDNETGETVTALSDGITEMTELQTRAAAKAKELETLITNDLSKLMTGDIPAAVKAMLTTLFAVTDTVGDDVRARESRFPALFRAGSTGSESSLRNLGDARTRTADKQGDFARLFNLTGLGDISGISGLSAGRRQLETQASGFENAAGPLRKVADLGEARAAKVLDLMNQATRAGRGQGDEFMELANIYNSLEEESEKLREELAALQVQADATRVTGTDLLADSATRLAGALGTNAARAAREASRSLEALTGTPEKMDRLRAIMGGRAADVSANLGGRGDEFAFGSPAEVDRRRLTLETQVEQLTKRRDALITSTRTAKEGGASSESLSGVRAQTHELSRQILTRQVILDDLLVQSDAIRASIVAGDFAKLDMDIQKVVESGSVETITRNMGFLNDVLDEMNDLTDDERGGIKKLIDDLDGAKKAAQNARELADELKRIKSVSSARQGAIRAVGSVAGGRAGSVLGSIAGIVGGVTSFSSIAATRTASHESNLAERDAGTINQGTFTNNESAINTVATMGKIAAGAELVGQGISIATTAWSMFNARAEAAKQKVREIQEAANAMGDAIAGGIAAGFDEGAQSFDDFMRNFLLNEFRTNLAETVLETSGIRAFTDDLAATKTLLADTTDRVDEILVQNKGLNKSITPDVLTNLSKLDPALLQNAKNLTALQRLTILKNAGAVLPQNEFGDTIPQGTTEFLQTLGNELATRAKLGGQLQDAAGEVEGFSEAIAGVQPIFDGFREALGLSTGAVKGVSEIATSTFRAVTEPQANLLLSATIEMRDLQVQIEFNTRRTAEVLTHDILGALLANGFNAGAREPEDVPTTPANLKLGDLKQGAEQVQNGQGVL